MVTARICGSISLQFNWASDYLWVLLIVFRTKWISSGFDLNRVIHIFCLCKMAKWRNVCISFFSTRGVSLN